MLTAALVFFCFSFFLSLPPSSSFPSITSREDFLYYSRFSPLFLAFPLTFFSFLLLVACFDSGCASLGGRAPQTLKGHWSPRNIGLCLSMRQHCEHGLIVRARPQRESTKGHRGSLWRPNMKGAPSFNED